MRPKVGANPPHTGPQSPSLESPLDAEKGVGKGGEGIEQKLCVLKIGFPICRGERMF